MISDYYGKAIYELISKWDFDELVQAVQSIYLILLLFFFTWLGFQILKGGVKR